MFCWVFKCLTLHENVIVSDTGRAGGDRAGSQRIVGGSSCCFSRSFGMVGLQLGTISSEMCKSYIS